MEEMNVNTVSAQIPTETEGGGEELLSDTSAESLDMPAEEEYPAIEEALDGEAVSDIDGTECDGDEDGYRLRAEEDLLILQREFPEMRGRSLADLPSPRRFGELRELGLSPREAYLATADRVSVGGKSHLRASRPTHSVSRAGTMTAAELRAASNLFPKLSGSEIVALYKRVNSQLL